MRSTLLAMVLAVGALPAHAAAIGTPAELMDVRRALAAAVAAEDASAAAPLIRFPVEGTSVGEAEFLRDPLQFRKLFDRGQSWIVNCLESGRAEKQDSPDFSDSPWRVECSGRTYYFGQFSGRWRLGAFSD
jgi:hypothetical protein